MPKRFGYLAAASSEIFPEFGSQPGGCNRQASTPAASMSRMQSSAVNEVTWRCDGLVGGPADQMWTCASTINMAFPLLLAKSISPCPTQIAHIMSTCYRHPRETRGSRGTAQTPRPWIPAFAGMTNNLLIL